MPKSLKMRFLVDENIRNDVKEFLISCGHDVIAVKPGSEDLEIARIAQETKRIILTHDQHFADILMFPPKEYSGIIRIKIHPPSPEIIISALNDFLPKFTPEQLNQKLFILENDGFRMR